MNSTPPDKSVWYAFGCSQQCTENFTKICMGSVAMGAIMHTSVLILMAFMMVMSDDSDELTIILSLPRTQSRVYDDWY